MTDDADLQKILRYVRGECSPEEASELRAWIDRDPARRAEVEAWLRVREAGRAREPLWDTERALAALEAERRRPTRVVRFPGATLPARRRLPAYAAAAAIVLAAAGGTLWLSRLSNSRPRAPDSVAMREYVTRPGQRADFRLGDGTHVLLSVASRLRVPADYGVRDRQLFLEGEAYFEVKHDPTARFLVHTDHATTEDLGTRFDVRAYARDSAIRVVVAEGRVAFRAVPGHEVMLGAGQLARATASGGIATESGGDIDRYLSWTHGTLAFRDTPLSEALPELSRWFGLDLQLGDSALSARRLTASFRNEPNDQMLAAIALTLDVRWERRGQTVTFYPREPGR